MIDTTGRVSTDGDLRRDQLTTFFAALSRRGVEVAQADETDEGGISLEYSIEGVSDQEAIADVNGIVGAFIGVQDNTELGGLEATVHGDEGGGGTTVKVDKIVADSYEGGRAAMRGLNDELDSHGV